MIFKQCSFFVFWLVLSCSSSRNDTVSSDLSVIGLDGREFFVPEFSDATKAKLDSNLRVAQKNFEADQTEDNYIWLGRREAYLYDYKRAVEIFSKGIEKFPESYKLYRHRGHRYITLREFDKAVADLQQAAALMPSAPLEVEPDGQPNKQNIPLSSTQFNVWYHLGLAHYLRGDLESALKAYLECMDVSVNDDLLCATSDWLYMTLKRLGLNNEANKVLEGISNDMTIIEDDSYHKRLLMYKGILPVDSVLNVNYQSDDIDLTLATEGYGVGNWYLYNNQLEKAIEIFNRVVEGKHFAAFGFIAAEVELQRIKNNSVSPSN